MTLRRKLEAALARIQQGWCQGVAAIDHERIPCDPASPHACAWCLVGALYFDREACKSLRSILKGSVCFWNDSKRRTQAEVVALLDGAIEECST